MNSNPTLYTGTVKTNIDPSGKFGVQKIKELISEIEGLLATDDYIYSEDLIDRFLEENVNNSILIPLRIRRLIKIVKMILIKPQLVILEWSSLELESVSSQEVFSLLNIWLPSTTFVVLLPNLHDLLLFDKVVVFKNGEIIEEARPDSLLSNSKSLLSYIVKMEDHGVYNKLVDDIKNGNC